MSEIHKVGLVGYGYWGSKLARVLTGLGVLQVICDISEERRDQAMREYGSQVRQIVPSLVFSDLELSDAVVIATPPDTHYTLAKAMLEEGKHVFCEKPLCSTAAETEELDALAQSKGLRLQSGLIYLYNGGLMAIPQPAGGCDLYFKIWNVAGAPSECTRDISTGILPHVFSVIQHFIGGAHCVLHRPYPLPEHVLEMRVDFPYSNSRAFIDVRDYAGIRRRDIELRVGIRRYRFDLDNPLVHLVCSGIEDEVYRAAGEEPLLAEMKDFLTGQVLTDRMNIRVAKMLDAYAYSFREDQGLSH